MIEPDRLLYIRWLAARFLLFQKHLSPVIDVRELELPHHVFIASFSEFSRATGVEEHILTGDGLLSDGYMIRRKNCRIVLYTQSYDTLCPQRLRFSLAHELGHISSIIVTMTKKVRQRRIVLLPRSLLMMPLFWR